MTESQFVPHLLQRASAFGLTITAREASKFESFYKLLARWNDRINLTALDLTLPPPMPTLDRLFIEPVVAAELVPTSPLVIADLGSGAGSPALPLSILRPAVVLAMVETRGRKAAFLREAVRTIGLDRARVFQEPFQTFSEAYSEKFDIVTMRALRLDAELGDAVDRLLKDEGRFITFGVEDTPAGFVRDRRLDLPDGSSVSSWVRE